MDDQEFWRVSCLTLQLVQLHGKIMWGIFYGQVWVPLVPIMPEKGGKGGGKVEVEVKVEGEEG